MPPPMPSASPAAIAEKDTPLTPHAPVPLEEAEKLLDVARDPSRETFIPVTRSALMDRLTATEAWPPKIAAEARRFFRYLDYWRHQQYTSRILDLEHSYEPFSPDSDLLQTRKYTETDRKRMQQRVIEGMEHLLEQANFRRISPDDVSLILTRESHYGLDLHVDFTVFEDVLIYYRGASTRRDRRRTLRKFLRKEEFDVPIFQRLFLLFKLKPLETQIREVMDKERISYQEARKIVARLRSMMPSEVRETNIYMKLFKNIPRSDIEMVFPNTVVKFRLRDKVKLGVTSAGGLGMGVAGAAGKIALAVTNPIAAAGAVAGLGAVIGRQVISFMNQKQKYMVVMAQNLYFHSMADNRGVMIKMADRAAEEDVKEEMLLYSVLVKERARRSDLPAIDRAIEQYLASVFDVNVDFDLSDALERLLRDGLVTEEPDGTLRTLSPRAAALHIDHLWDKFLDELPDPTRGEGTEINGDGVKLARGLSETAPPPDGGIASDMF
ncbi:MAG: DUF3754 domain-containing protein [Hyphomicrobiaceae bacterium]|nr:DUF3754 domain-containing protein [Hyphomicrobiaceae bacterium]